MLNVVSKLVIALISPLGTALALAALALWLVARQRRRPAASVAAFAVGWLVFWSLPVASTWLHGIAVGDTAFVPIDRLPSADAIVVLGGGVGRPETPGERPDLNAAADRVWFGASLYHAGKAPLVILSGGGDPDASPISEADAMLLLLKDFGVPESAIVLEGRSINTTQNAQFTREILQQRGLGHVLLVTSALHMERAIARFEAEGVNATAAPTDFETWAIETWRLWIPDTGALNGSATAIKEIVGRFAGR